MFSVFLWCFCVVMFVNFILNVVLFSMVICGMSVNDWKIIVIFFLCILWSLVFDILVILMLLISICLWVGLIRWLRRCIIVDLFELDNFMMINILFFLMVRLVFLMLSDSFVFFSICFFDSFFLIYLKVCCGCFLNILYRFFIFNLIVM